MKSKLLISAATCALFLAVAMPSAAAQSARSEPSKTAVAAMPRWRSAAFPGNSVVRLQYQEVSVARILEVQQHNRSRRVKPAQVGIGRFATSEAHAGGLPALNWVAMGDGSAVARVQVTSPVALGIRVGLQVNALDPRVELRFAGSDDPTRVVAMMTGKEVRALADARGLFWTPGTDGESQLIEAYLPPRVPRNLVKLQAPALSHLLANTRNDFKIVEKIGESGTCNVDTACRVAELGANFVSAKNAVAHMVFTYSTGATYFCSGTLLADTLEGSQIPYFYTANHCFAGGDGLPVQNFQTVANSLNTYWKYEATACGSGVQAAKLPLAGGSDYLYSNPDTDGMLLRLRNAPPAGAEFAGWDSAAIAPSSTIVGIHHPSGDAKKVSSGQHVPADSDGFLSAVGWLSGTTEGGSSGSGLFTTSASGYKLRGGLYGGSASCDNDGSLANPDNRDYYSRFDVIFPSIRQWLAPVAATPIRVNGSQPRLPPSSAATAPSGSAGPAGKALRKRAAPIVLRIER